MKSLDDAKTVLDAYHSGKATIVGQTKQGAPIVKFDNVTGTFRNTLNTGKIINEPSNVFIIKGTKSPSVVPANPQTYK